MAEKSVAVAPNYDAWIPVLDAIVARQPDLKSTMTVAAVHAFMQLPDDSFGWTGKKDGPPMSKEQKALAIIAHLQLDLIPGMGHIFFLGNKLYLAAEGMRYIANRGSKFRWAGDREIRPLTDDEKEMLAWEPGDRALAMEETALIEGKPIRVRGYAIIEKRELDFRSGNFAKPGLGSKKDIFETLITRAERSIFKRYLALGGVSADEPGSREDVMEVVAVETPVNQVAIQAADDLETAKTSFLEAASRAGDTRAVEILGEPPEFYLEANAKDLKKIVAATLALQDSAQT